MNQVQRSVAAKITWTVWVHEDFALSESLLRLEPSWYHQGQLFSLPATKGRTFSDRFRNSCLLWSRSAIIIIIIIKAAWPDTVLRADTRRLLPRHNIQLHLTITMSTAGGWDILMSPVVGIQCLEQSTVWVLTLTCIGRRVELEEHSQYSIQDILVQVLYPLLSSTDVTCCIHFEHSIQNLTQSAFRIFVVRSFTSGKLKWWKMSLPVCSFFLNSECACARCWSGIWLPPNTLLSYSALLLASDTPLFHSYEFSGKTQNREVVQGWALCKQTYYSYLELKSAIQECLCHAQDILTQVRYINLDFCWTFQ